MAEKVIDNDKESDMLQYLNAQRDEADALWRAMQHRQAEMLSGDFRGSNELLNSVFKKRKKEKTAGTDT